MIAPKEYSPSTVHHQIMDSIEPSYGWTPDSNFDTWREAWRPVLRDLVLANMPENKCDLGVRNFWKRETDLGTIEKIDFICEPGSRTPAYVCLPANATPPYRFCVCVQGHSSGMHNSIAVERDDEVSPIKVEGDRDFALGCMRRGIAAICIEQRGLHGERLEKQIPSKAWSCYVESMHALMLGRTMIGERVYDVDRAIDYLATRDDVGMDRIGVMGNSGGGTTTVFSAALLDRVAWAMPSCYFCTFRDSILAVDHCLCNYIPGLYRYAEMSDVLGLFAPSPVVIVSGLEDDLFPIGAARREFERLQRIYAAAGAADNCKIIEGPEGHRFYADLAWPLMLDMIQNM